MACGIGDMVLPGVVELLGVSRELPSQAGTYSSTAVPAAASPPQRRSTGRVGVGVLELLLLAAGVPSLDIDPAPVIVTEALAL